MFDDTQDGVQQQPQQQPPAAASEPVDMFKDTESPPDSFVPAPVAPADAAGVNPSALDAGKLKPKLTPDAAAAEMVHANGMAGAGEAHAPTALKRIILALVILVVMAVIGAGVRWFVVAQQKSTQPVATQQVPPPAKTDAPSSQPSPNIVNIDVSGAPVQPASSTPTTVTTTPTQFAVQPPEKPPTIITATTTSSTNCAGATMDSDKDGLTDCEEINLYNTDPQNPDTDGDGLTDGVEIKIWGTDPLKRDTDADGYTDGEEVFHGYNPRGPGKLQ